VHEVDKLPTATDAPDADAIAIVIQRRIGELRRRYPEIILLRESLREDPFQLRPEIVFIPTFENTVAGFLRVEAVTEICGHHSGERIRVMRGHRFLEPPDERLEIHVVILLAQVRLGPLGHGRLFILLLVKEIAAAQSERTEKKNKRDFFHAGIVLSDLRARLKSLPTPPGMGNEHEIDRAHQIDEGTGRVGYPQRPAA